MVINKVAQLSLMAGLLLLVGGFSSGCSREDGLYRFHGTATYRGEPIPRGIIVLEPDTSKGNRGQAGSATIVDGKFDTQLSGSGFIGGPHIITVQGFDGKNIDPDVAPYGTPIGRGKRYIEPLDLPKEDVELDIDMAKLVDK